MQEGGASKRPAVGERYGALGGVENQLDPPVPDGIDNMGTALGHFVDLFRLDAVIHQA